MSRKISVVMPCLNAGAFLGPAVASVLGQEPARDFALELIIVDDASSDPTTLATLRTLGPDTRVKVLRNENCTGAAASRNEGLRHCTGDYIAFLDADDLWKPNHLDLHLSLRAEFAATLTSTDYDLIDQSGQVITHGAMLSSTHKGPRLRQAMQGQARLALERPRVLFIEICPAWTGSVVVDRGSLAEVGTFNDRLRYGEDVELWTRLSARCRFAFASDVTAQHRRNPRSLVSTARAGAVDLALAEVYAELREHDDFRGLAAVLRPRATANFLAAARAFRQGGAQGVAAQCALRGIQQSPFVLVGYQEALLALVGLGRRAGGSTISRESS